MFPPHFPLMFVLLTHVAIVKFGDAASMGSGSKPKIEKELEAKLQKGIKTNVLVTFESTSYTLHKLKFNKSFHIDSRQKAKKVREALTMLTDHDQWNVVKMLSKEAKKFHLDYEQYWISNSMLIKYADLDLVTMIAKDSLVSEIYEERSFPSADKGVLSRVSPYADNGHYDTQNLTWGLKRMQVPEAWVELGGPQNAGAGVVVGIMDTGAFVEHEALQDNFLGRYGWFDPWNLSMETPTDYSGVGTHQTGIAVGKNGIAIAAKFSICRACFTATCYIPQIIKCVQFFLCPTLPDGTQEDCSKAVDVLQISFMNFQVYHPWFEPYADALETAGIISVAPIGSGNLECYSVMYPASLDNVIAVGATDYNDELLPSNAVGPSLKNLNMKPDVVAPGEHIKSAKEDPDEPYMYLDGTIPAAAHVTGLVALLKGRDKGLTFEQVRDLIRDHADTHVKAQASTPCGGTTEKNVPNAYFGWGRINAFKAVKAQTALLNKKRVK